MQVTNEFTELMQVLKTISRQLKCLIDLTQQCCYATPQFYDVELLYAPSGDIFCVADEINIRYLVRNAGTLTIPSGTTISLTTDTTIIESIIVGTEATFTNTTTLVLNQDLEPGSFFTISIRYEHECTEAENIILTLGLIELPETYLDNNSYNYNYTP